MRDIIAEIIDPVPFSSISDDSPSWEERRKVARIRALHIIEEMSNPQNMDIDAFMNSLRGLMIDMGHDPGDATMEARAIFATALSEMFKNMRE